MAINFSEEMIRNVVSQVLAEVGPPPQVDHDCSCDGYSSASTGSYAGRNGIFLDAEQAVAAAQEAFELLSRATMEDRKKAIDHIRRIANDQSVELGTLEMNETKVGKLEHKIAKLQALAEKAPGIEFMSSQVYLSLIHI